MYMHTMAEILEPDNVIINLQDLINPPTFETLLLESTVGTEGFWNGVLLQYMYVFIYKKCAWLRHLGEEATAIQPVHTKKTNLFTPSIKNGYWVCLLFLYVQVLHDHFFH